MEFNIPCFLCYNKRVSEKITIAIKSIQLLGGYIGFILQKYQ